MGFDIESGSTIEDGDGIERKIWVIPNGASDPPEAEPEDLIFEEA